MRLTSRATTFADLPMAPSLTPLGLSSRLLLRPSSSSLMAATSLSTLRRGFPPMSARRPPPMHLGLCLLKLLFATATAGTGVWGTTAAAIDGDASALAASGKLRWIPVHKAQHEAIRLRASDGDLVTACE